jgi:hypothetical protein
MEPTVHECECTSVMTCCLCTLVLPTLHWYIMCSCGCIWYPYHLEWPSNSTMILWWIYILVVAWSGCFLLALITLLGKAVSMWSPHNHLIPYAGSTDNLVYSRDSLIRSVYFCLLSFLPFFSTLYKEYPLYFGSYLSYALLQQFHCWVSPATA